MKGECVMKVSWNKFKKIVFAVLCIVAGVMWSFIVSMFCLTADSCRDGGWHDTVDKRFNSEIDLEGCLQPHDSEKWRFGYELPFISYQYYFKHYIDDGSITEFDFKALVNDIAEYADEKVGKYKTEVSIERYYNGFKETYIYSIVFKKRCRTPFWV